MVATVAGSENVLANGTPAVRDSNSQLVPNLARVTALVAVRCPALLSNISPLARSGHQTNRERSVDSARCRWIGHCVESSSLAVSGRVRGHSVTVLGVALTTDHRLAMATTANLGVVERTVIERVMREVGGNKVRAAQRLGISRTQLYGRLRKYGLRV